MTKACFRKHVSRGRFKPDKDKLVGRSVVLARFIMHTTVVAAIVVVRQERLCLFVDAFVEEDGEEGCYKRHDGIQVD